MPSSPNFAAIAAGFARAQVAVQTLTQALVPLAQIHQAMRDLYQDVPVLPSQRGALELSVRQAARAFGRAQGRPTRLSCLRQRLRGLGAEDFREDIGISRRHLVVHLAADAPEGLQQRDLVLVLRVQVRDDRERWALYLATLARLDPHAPDEVKALDAILTASGMLVTETT